MSKRNSMSKIKENCRKEKEKKMMKDEQSKSKVTNSHKRNEERW